MNFEPNQGQTDKQVQFLSRGPGYTLFLTPTEAVLSLRGSTREKREKRSTGENHQYRNVRMQLIGANPKPQVSGVDILPGKVNYFRGVQPQFSAFGGKNQVALRINREVFCPNKSQTDGFGIGSRPYYEVMFQLPLIAVIDEVNARVDVFVVDLSIGLNVGTPLTGLGASPWSIRKSAVNGGRSRGVICCTRQRRKPRPR